MNKVTKLIILILLSTSVYFIFNYTNKKTIKLLTIGDESIQGINSFGIKEYSYTDYYIDYLKQKNIKVEINTYTKKELTIKELKDNLNNSSKLKRYLTEAHLLILNVGYNDLLFQLSKKQNLKKQLNNISNNYQELLTIIRKYYKNDIIIVGYYPTNEQDYYKNIGIRYLNNILKSDNNITYIDTYYLLHNRKKYFSNPHSYYPNRLGYKTIGNKIIEKTLEKQ